VVFTGSIRRERVVRRDLAEKVEPKPSRKRWGEADQAMGGSAFHTYGNV
jgi:hypothetical protein